MKATRRPTFWGNGQGYSAPRRRVPEEQPKSQHKDIFAALRHYAETGEVPDVSELRAMADAERAARERKAMAAQAYNAQALIYYFRVGNRIKIGWTRNLAQRIATLMPEEVLATEPGLQRLETTRHHQFAQYRITREWFKDCPAIREHIATLSR